MKIVFVLQTLKRGGAERVVSVLSKIFEKEGHRVFIVLFRKLVEYDYGGEIVSIESPPASSKAVKILRLRERVKKLKEFFGKEKPDAIFSFVESSNFASVLTGERVIVSVRNNPLKKHEVWQRVLIKTLYKRENVLKVVAVSRKIEEILKKNFSLSNTVSIPNPVVFDFGNETKEYLGRYEPFVLAVGRLHPQKNFPMLIRAFKSSKTSKEAKLLIAGEGEERGKLERLIRELNLKEKVFLLGEVKNIADYYKQASMFVLSSDYEGFPNVLAEALSFGVPSVSTECPTGPDEMIKNFENGILTPVGNELFMRYAIDRLYFDTKLQKKFRYNAPESIAHLKAENIARRWLELV